MLAVNQLRDKGINSVSASTDIQNIIQGNYKNFKYGEKNGTFTFRFAMIYERINYMTKRNPAEICLGLGLGHSDYSKVQSMYHFRIGTLTADKGIGQLSSADFAWVAILCQWGSIGLILFCLIFTSFEKSFWTNRKNNSLCIINFVYLIYLLIWSFAGSNFANAQYYLLPCLCYYLIIKTKTFHYLIWSK